MMSDDDDDIINMMARNPAWQKGATANRLRFLLGLTMGIQLSIILIGWSIRDVPNYLAIKFQQLGTCMGFAFVVKTINEVWLDVAMVEFTSRLLKKSAGNTDVVFSDIGLKTHQRRANYHSKNYAKGRVPSLPYLGPYNFHYELPQSIGEIGLSVAMIVLFLIDRNTYAYWWDSMVLGQYSVDLIFICCRFRE